MVFGSICVGTIGNNQRRQLPSPFGKPLGQQSKMPEENQSRNSFAKEAGTGTETARRNQCVFNIGMRVWITKGVYQGKSGEIVGQVHANSNFYTVQIEGLQGKFQVSCLALSHKPPIAMPSVNVTPPLQSCKRKVSQLTSDLPAVCRKTKSEANGMALYAKGTAVMVVEGTYQGSRGVVQGKARAGTTVLDGQLRVLLTSPKEMNIFLPVTFMQPVSRQPKQIAELSFPNGEVSSPTPTPVEMTAISNTHNIGSQKEPVSRTPYSMQTLAMHESTAPMGLQCAIFADTGDLTSLFALLH